VFALPRTCTSQRFPVPVVERYLDVDAGKRMTEFRNDLVMRMIEEISFLSARLAGLQAMGMNDEILKEVERLEQGAGKLEPDGFEVVRQPLEKLKTKAGIPD